MISLKTFPTAVSCEVIAEDWDRLISKCASPNPFYSPEMLLSAWECYGNSRVHVLTAWDRKALVALLPVNTIYNFKYFPVLHSMAWRYRHCYSCMPLFAKGYETRAMQAICSHYQGFGRLFSIYDLPMEFSDASVLKSICDKSNKSYLNGHERACLRPLRAERESIESQIRTKSLKEFRRQKRSLSTQGKFRFNHHRSTAVTKARLKAFLELECAGWKGRQGTALLSNKADRHFANTALDKLADKGCLQVFELMLDEKPIAILLAIECGCELYTFKIAHDPEFDRYSPGVLLMLECSKLWEQEAYYRMIDSCATPEHSLVNRIWYERRSIAKFHISGSDPYTRALVALRNLRNPPVFANEAA